MSSIAKTSEITGVSEVEHLSAIEYNHQFAYIRKLSTRAATEIDGLHLRTMGLGRFRNVVDGTPIFGTDMELREHVENQVLSLIMQSVELGYRHGNLDALNNAKGE